MSDCPWASPAHVELMRPLRASQTAYLVRGGRIKTIAIVIFSSEALPSLQRLAVKTSTDDGRSNSQP